MHRGWTTGSTACSTGLDRWQRRARVRIPMNSAGIITPEFMQGACPFVSRDSRLTQGVFDLPIYGLVAAGMGSDGEARAEHDLCPDASAILFNKAANSTGGNESLERLWRFYISIRSAGITNPCRA